MKACLCLKLLLSDMPFRREQENGIAVAIVQELVVCYAADIPMYMMKQIV
jgi:hypothetical protein